MAIKNNYPTIRPSLDLNFAGSKVVDPRITFTRASTATYYDGKTVAKAEENLFLNSNSPSLAAIKEITRTNEAAVAPDGTATAFLITPTTENAFHSAGYLPLVGTNHSTTNPVVFSFYAKPNGYTKLRIGEGGSSRFYATLDIVSGEVSAQGGPGFVSLSTIALADGWVRVVLVVSAIGHLSFTPMPDSGYTPGNYGNATFAGDGVSGMYFWGFQAEQRDQVTAYTPTTDQPITRYQPVLLTAPANTPRIDHDPITGECKGLLIEESRTNLLTYSEQFGSAVWTKTNASISANVMVAPDGTLTADKLVAHSGTVSSSVSRIADSLQTISVFSKKGEFRYLTIAVNAFAVYSATYDLENGVVTQFSTGYGDSVQTIQDVGGGWFRCVFTMSTSVPSSNITINFKPSSAPTGNHVGTTVVGDGYSGIYIWGAQLEVRAFPTSYIKTEASQVTRAEEKAYLPISSWYSFGGEGSFLYNFVQGLPISSQDSNAMYFGLFGSSALINGDDRGFALYANNRYLSRNPTNGDPALTGNAGLTKVALAMDSLGKYGTKNGESVVSLAGSSLNNVLSPTHFSLSGSTHSRHCHHVRRIAYYPKRLSNAQLQALTL